MDVEYGETRLAGVWPLRPPQGAPSTVLIHLLTLSLKRYCLNIKSRFAFSICMGK